MTKGTTTARLPTEGSFASEVRHRPPTPSSLIGVGSRLGVWGLVGGFGVMTAFTLGAPLSLGLAISAMGAGLLTSGLGTLAASVGVLRHPDPVPRLLRASAVAGIPLGGALTVLGVASLSLWPPLVSTVGVVTPVAGALGVVVVLLLVVALLLGLRGEARDAE